MVQFETFFAINAEYPTQLHASHVSKSIFLFHRFAGMVEKGMAIGQLRVAATFWSQREPLWRHHQRKLPWHRPRTLHKCSATDAFVRSEWCLNYATYLFTDTFTHTLKREKHVQLGFDSIEKQVQSCCILHVNFHSAFDNALNRVHTQCWC